MKLINITLISIFIFLTGCSTTTLVKTQNNIPKLNYDTNSTSKVENMSLTLFRLSNYTDTPRAGMRASNILEGILQTKGFDVSSHIQMKLPTKKEARDIALKDGSQYYIYGGVSEWRYKTGIDGEPAVSLVCSLYETNTSLLIWSATGADSDWGNGSIGIVAQDLLEKMLQD